MKAILILLVSCLTLTESKAQQTDPPLEKDFTTYYFIRHAEKESSDPTNKDPELSDLGKQRAEKWVEILKAVDFDEIFSTDYIRTRSTASTIASALGREVQIYDPSKLFDPVFQENTKGKTVLVVGHSNTNPAFVNRILGEQKYPDIDEDESGSLFIVTVAPTGEKTSQVLYIN